MAKKNLKLAATIEKLSKGKESRNNRLTEKEIAKFIDGQIILKEKEIAEAKVTLKETSEENYDDFKSALLNGLEGEDISSRADRKRVAERYCLKAVKTLTENEEYSNGGVVENDGEVIDIKKLQNQIKQLKKLRTELEEIDVEVEEEA